MEKVEIESGETRTVEFKKELPQNSSKGIKIESQLFKYK